MSNSLALAHIASHELEYGGLKLGSNLKQGSFLCYLMKVYSLRPTFTVVVVLQWIKISCPWCFPCAFSVCRLVHSHHCVAIASKMQGSNHTAHVDTWLYHAAWVASSEKPVSI